MKIATIQTPMAWMIDDNLRTILQSISAAKQMGADVAVFPECTLIGYHRNRGVGISPRIIDEALTRIGECCAAVGIASVVGSPYYSDTRQDKPWNAMVVFTDTGQISAVFPKIILTRTEQVLDIFTPGTLSSRRSFQLYDRTCVVLICCELNGDLHNPHPHYRDILPLLDIPPEVVFVPGVLDMSEDADVPNATAARALANEFQTAVVIANWPEWGGPAPKGCLGRSLTITADGKVISEATANQPSITVAVI
jgi:predicted amidohydrolase